VARSRAHRRRDQAARRRGRFPAWVAERRAAPRPTLFIKGNHEDFVWLDAQRSSEVLPGLHYLRNGHVRELVAGDEVLPSNVIDGARRRLRDGHLGAALGSGSDRSAKPG
jgi:hypothetical protein